MYHRLLLGALALTISGVFAACGDDDDSDGAEDAATATQTSAATSAATTVPDHELVGEWSATLAPNDEAVLVLRAAGYTIRRGPNNARGAVRVEEGQIEFYGSNICSGSGLYSWTLEGDTLELASIEPDECPGRAEALDGVTYTR